MAFDLGYDESGSGDRLLVSVQVGVTEQARRLKKQWRKRLGELEFFHSKDFGNYNSGIFTKAGLDRWQRSALLSDLSKLIHRYLLFSVTAAVSIEEYNANTTPKFRSRMGTAYGFLIDMCLLSAHACLGDLGLKSEYNILIESGHRNSEQVAQILELVRDIPVDLLPFPLKIVTSGLGDKREHPILQCADMAAYSDWQGYSDGDPTIWNALHRKGVRYHAWRVKCDENLIRQFVEGDGPARQELVNKSISHD